MKLVYATCDVDSECHFCIIIDTKIRRANAEHDWIAHWWPEGCRFAASIERAKDTFKSLEEEICTVEIH